MTIAQCPECSEQVRIPPGVGADAEVRCPLCLADYSLGVVLTKLPPQLIVIDVANAFAEPAASSAGTENSPIAASDSAKTNSAATAAFESRPFRAPALRLSRTPRQSPSALKEIVKVLGGGVVGLTIGQLILWWLPGQWKRDPFELGPKISLYAPMIVPRTFQDRSIRAKHDGSQDELTIDQRWPDSQSSPLAQSPASGGASVNDPHQDVSTAKRAARTSVVTPAFDAPEFDSVDAGAGVTGALLQIELEDISNSPRATSGALASGDADPVPPASVSEEAQREPVEVRTAPGVTRQDFLERLSQAASANDAWDRANADDPIEYRKRSAGLYQALARLGEALTYVNHQDASVIESLLKVNGLVRSISRDDAKMKLIRKVAAGWMKAKRPHNGVCLNGVATSIETRGQLYATEITMASGGTLTLVGTVNPSTHFQMGADILVLGTILENPRQNLDGFEGDEPVVILDGFHLGLSVKD